MAETTGTTWTCYDATTMTAREIYGRVLAELSEKDERIVGLSADLAKSTAISIFEKAHPNRFFNVGIAEQNLMGVAAGMAKAGLIPFASTFAGFAAMRACEQVRTDICYQNLPVKIIATHSGMSFGAAGTTHHCTEDLAIMRSFANMTVIVPADGVETANAVRAVKDLPGPAYIRIGRGFELQAVEAAKALKVSDGLSVRVLNMHTIKPIDTEAIMSAVTDTRRILTVEEHNTMGGLGTAVADVIAESGKGCAFSKVGLPDTYAVMGYPEDLYAHYGLDANGIIEQVRKLLAVEFEEDEDWDDEV